MPHNYSNNCYVYTGTHDNETLYGWFMGMPKTRKKVIREYLSDDFTPDELMHKKLIDLAMMSAAKTCVIPMQDWLLLGDEARINTPSTTGKNWVWRMDRGAASPELAAQIRRMTRTYGR
jgi:4-alpha-glucanotransferase